MFHGHRVSLRTLTALTVALVSLSATLLTACGSSSQSSGPVTIRLGRWTGGDTFDAQFKAWVGQFESSHPNIKVSIEQLPYGDYFDKLKVSTVGGTAYDVVGIATGSVADLFSKSAFVDLKTLSGYNSAITNLDPNTVTLTQWDSKQYALPVGIPTPVLAYNKNLFTAAGIPLPDTTTPLTFAQFKDIAKKLTITQDGKVTQYGFMPPYFFSANALVYDEGGQVYDNPVNPKKILINSPQGIQGLTDYLSLFQDNIVPSLEDQANGPWGGGDIAALQTNKVGISTIGTWDFPTITSQSLPYGVMPYFTINGKSAVEDSINGFGIYRGSKQKDAAWEFVKWAASTEGQTGLAKFSDIPADKTVLSQLGTILQPAAFVPAVVADEASVHSFALTPNTQLGTIFTTILTDMVHGKYTPAQAAAALEQQGNAALAASS